MGSPHRRRTQLREEGEEDKPMRRARLLLALVLIWVSILPAGIGQAGSAYQVTDAHLQAETVLAQLSPEEKVGQLFLVTFKGTDVTPGSQISELVTKYHIGGVMLNTANDNFIGPDGTVSDIYRMITSLQRQVWEINQASISGGAADGTSTPSHYVPLLVGVAQDGDGFPYDQILNGMTPLPDQMAIGATWNPDLSRQVGAVLGSELSAMGFNFYLGPSLDVLGTMSVDSMDDMGTRTFGSSPYWVGQMGKSYVQGLHEGSNNRIAVVTKHFPGRGAADRPADQEVATVRKNIDQLKETELVPFYAVTTNTARTAQTDGVILSHLRYGFQGSIRPTTRPISLDPAALDILLKLPEFSDWRNDSGGVVVSDDLGSPALRKYYETTGQAYDPRQIARNAFLAGNDLLYVNNFIADGDPDSYTTVLRTVSLFAQKYREDPAFAERVDASVVRLLEMKFRMYPRLTLDTVLPPEDGLSKIGQSQQVAFEVARQAVTLISPDPGELETGIARPPNASDRIVFISDVRGGRQCSRCPDQVWMSADALQNAVMRLYGPQSGGQVYESRMSSYSLIDLQNMLNGLSGSDLSPIEQDLRQASWVVFVMLNSQRDHTESQAIRRFLSDRPDLFRSRKVIAFAFNAPYFLDATDISKLTAYYALYSKTPAFIDVAARILFQELTPSGASPVSVPGTGYDLMTVTAPEARQIITLSLDIPAPPQSGVTTITPQPTPIPVFKVGDVLPLKTGEIYDNNHNQVPDGTPVKFLFTVGGETGTVQQVDARTSGGIARASYRIMSTGLLEVRVVSEPAETSQMIRLDISDRGGIVTPIVPTPAPTETPTPTETITPTITPTAVVPVLPPARPLSSDWALAMLIAWGGGLVIFLLARWRLSMRWALRWGLASAAGGLLSYVYLAAMRLMREDEARQMTTDKILLFTLTGVFVGWFIAWLWQQFSRQKAKTPPEKHITGPR